MVARRLSDELAHARRPGAHHSAAVKQPPDVPNASATVALTRSDHRNLLLATWTRNRGDPVGLDGDQ